MAAAVALVGGILLGSRATSGGWLAIALAFAALLLLRASRGPERGRAVGRAASVLCFGAIGFVSGLWRVAAPSRQAWKTYVRLPAGQARESVRIEGVLVDFWSGAPPRARTRLRAERLFSGGSWLPFPAEVFLFVSGSKSPSRVSDRGDRVLLVGRLRPEDLPASDRDVALPWTRYRLSVKSALQIDRRGGTPLSLLQWPNRRLFRALPEGNAAYERDVRGPLAALLLGRTSELDRGVVAEYRRGGLYHLLVVSGLHVALAAGLVWWALRLAGVRGKRREALLLFAVLAIVLVGGANPPAVRAGLVFAVFLLARLLERPIAGAQALGLSALILFLAAPAEVYSLGTALTFAAVGGIALLSAPIRSRLPRRPEWLFSGLATAFGAEIATAPILLWRFNLVAGGAWLTAPLSIPLSGLLIALGGALLACFAAGFSPPPLIALFGAGTRALEYLAERAAGVAFLRPTPPLTAVLAVLVLVFAAARLSRWRRAAAAGLAAAGFAFLALRPGPRGPARGFSIEALDVGQGDALLLRSGSRALLVDGGGPFDREARDFGRTHLLPKLLDRGVTRLDAVLVTHPHPDHALGVFAVLEELPVGRLWLSSGDDEAALYEDLESACRRAGVPARALSAGEVSLVAGGRLSVLHSGGRRRKVDPVNNQSVVAVFEKDGRRALLTGDAGSATEHALVRAGALSPVDLLKVGHHGSRSSTSAAFVAALRPRAALISCGRENRFGHPAPETLRTLGAQGVHVFRTDLSSDVRVELAPGGVTRLWRRGP